MKLADLQQARVAVLGLGLEGQAVLAALQQHLPRLVVDVLCEQVPTATPALSAVQRNMTGQLHVAPISAEALQGYEVLIKSPGISLYHPALQAALDAGVHVTSGTNIWFSERLGERVVAITGTKGKSTTAALTAHLLRGGGINTQLAGNIGVPLISLLAAGADVWVLELSSFQIADLVAEVELAVLLSLFDEHLDWHRSAAQYRQDKLRLLSMAQQRVLVTNELQNSVREVLPTLSAAMHCFGAGADGWQPTADGWQHGDGRTLSAAGFKLRGQHNYVNACAALTVADHFAADMSQLQAALASFTPLPHRLQTVAANRHYTFINDSIATTPLATVMALQALADERICLIVGGYDRGLGWDALLDELQQRLPYAVYGLPDTGAALVTALQQRLLQSGLSLPPGGLHQAADLDAVFAALPALPEQTLTVLLSPGAASFSQFRNFEQRGDHFATLAQAFVSHTARQ